MRTDEEFADLIPFYLMDQLADEDRRELEDRIASSSFLQKELRFWRGIQTVATESNAEQHATNEEILAFTDHTPDITAIRRAEIENHLRGCRSCNEKVNLIKRINNELPGIALPQAKPLQEVLKKWLVGPAPAPQPIYGTGSLFGLLLTSPRAAMIGVSALVVMLVAIPFIQHPARSLQYGPPLEPLVAERGAGEGPTIQLRKDATDLGLTLYVSSERTTAGSFKIALRDPIGKRTVLPGLAVASPDTGGYRSVRLEVSALRFARSGVYSIIAYPSPSDSIVYSFNLIVPRE